MAPNDTDLLDLLQDISACLGQMPPAELRVFAQHWQDLAAYLHQGQSTQAEFTAQLQQAVAASPLLRHERLDRLLAQELAKTRYTPTAASATPPVAQAGLAPVRNEVVRAVYQVGEQVRQYLAATSA